MSAAVMARLLVNRSMVVSSLLIQSIGIGWDRLWSGGRNVHRAGQARSIAIVRGNEDVAVTFGVVKRGFGEGSSLSGF
jgi:hypothetical protein